MVVKQGKSAGRRMARFILEDSVGRCEVVAFAEVFETLGPILKDDAMVCLGVTLSTRDSSNLILQDACPLETAGEKRGAGLLLQLSEEVQQDPVRRRNIMDLLKKHAPGTVPVHFQMLRKDCEPVSFRAGQDWKIRASRPLLLELGEILGTHRIQWIGREPAAREPRNGYSRS
jgi:DNA polymerase III alpha subunit